MQYRVAVYAEELGQWVQIGPVFSELDEAVRFLDSFATPFKRVVQLSASSEPAPPRPEALGLDLRRLEFVRFLVRTGRVSEDLDPPDVSRAA